MAGALAMLPFAARSSPWSGNAVVAVHRDRPHHPDLSR
jgi:hypothetical protein